MYYAYLEKKVKINPFASNTIKHVKVPEMVYTNPRYHHLLDHIAIVSK